MQTNTTIISPSSGINSLKSKYYWVVLNPVCLFLLACSIGFSPLAVVQANPINSVLLPDTIWVTLDGNDNNPGTKNKPVKTVEKAIDLHQDNGVVTLEKGTYTLTKKLVIEKPITLIGGYENGQMTSSTSVLLSVAGASVMTISTGKTTKNYIKNMTLTGAPDTDWNTSVAVVNLFSSWLELENVGIIAATGPAGIGGDGGNNGSPGKNGSSGGNNQDNGGAGGSSESDAAGGKGGDRGYINVENGWTTCSWHWKNYNGDSGRDGGSGFYASGGSAGTNDSGAIYSDATKGKAGQNGQNGTCGHPGGESVNGTYKYIGYFKYGTGPSKQPYFNSMAGGDGQDGSNGTGGGGGGTGGNFLDVGMTSCTGYTGNPGGGGGSGGTGATKGKGGLMGSSVMGIFMYHSILNFKEDIVITIADAGDGGNGGDGAYGGQGGKGGSGGTGSSSSEGAKDGGNGGNGGNGGSSSGGAGGNGGSCVGIIYFDASKETINGTATFHLGQPGKGGQGGKAKDPCAHAGENGYDGIKIERLDLKRR